MMFDDWSWFWEPWITRLTSISQGVSRLLWATLLCSYVFVLFFQRWCGNILLATNWFLTILIAHVILQYTTFFNIFFKTPTSGCQDWWFDTTEVCGGTAKQHSVAKIWFRERCHCHPLTRSTCRSCKGAPLPAATRLLTLLTSKLKLEVSQAEQLQPCFGLVLSCICPCHAL